MSEPREPTRTEVHRVADPEATRVASYLAQPGEVGRVLLLYSGGLDTSVMLKWIQDEYDAEVVALTVNLGQPGEDYEVVKGKALRLGAIEAHVVDAREEFAHEYVLPAIKANADYGDGYPLFTALGRPLIAKLAVEYARKTGCDTIAHGCTGKGNDQVRIEGTVATLAPELKVIAPVRSWQMGRDEEIAYARKHGIPVKGGTETAPYSIDDNLWGRSSEGSWIEDLSHAPDDDVFQLVTRPELAPDEPQVVEVEFERGVPVAMDGERLPLVDLIERAAEIGCRHGVGIVDHIEDRIVGLKVRDIYEVPAAAILLPAHSELERLVGTIHQNQFKPRLDQQWAYLVYAGLWWEPLRTDIEAYMDIVNERVTGKIGLKLYKGHARVVTRESAERGLRRAARDVRRVGRAVLAAGVAGLHRDLVAAVADGAARARRRRAGKVGPCSTSSSASSCGRAPRSSCAGSTGRPTCPRRCSPVRSCWSGCWSACCSPSATPTDRLARFPGSALRREPAGASGTIAAVTESAPAVDPRRPRVRGGRMAALRRRHRPRARARALVAGAARPEGLPVLCASVGGGVSRYESLPDAPSARGNGSVWRGAYLLPRRSRARRLAGVGERRALGAAGPAGPRRARGAGCRRSWGRRSRGARRRGHRPRRDGRAPRPARRGGRAGAGAGGLGGVAGAGRARAARVGARARVEALVAERDALAARAAELERRTPRDEHQRAALADALAARRRPGAARATCRSACRRRRSRVRATRCGCACSRRARPARPRCAPSGRRRRPSSPPRGVARRSSRPRPPAPGSRRSPRRPTSTTPAATSPTGSRRAPPSSTGRAQSSPSTSPSSVRRRPSSRT